MTRNQLRSPIIDLTEMSELERFDELLTPEQKDEIMRSFREILGDEEIAEMVDVIISRDGPDVAELGLRLEQKRNEYITSEMKSDYWTDILHDRHEWLSAAECAV